MLIGLAAIGFLVFAVAPVGSRDAAGSRATAFRGRRRCRTGSDGSSCSAVRSIRAFAGLWGDCIQQLGRTGARRHRTGPAFNPEAKLALVRGEGEMFPIGFARGARDSGFRPRRGIAATRSSSRSARAAPMKRRLARTKPAVARASANPIGNISPSPPTSASFASG